MFDLLTLVVNTLVVDLFVDVISDLVTNGISGVILMIETSVTVVPSQISPPIPVTGGTL